jgi:hypothetical protein
VHERVQTSARKRNGCSSSGFTTPSTDGDRGQKYRCFSESESGSESDNLVGTDDDAMIFCLCLSDGDTAL